MFEKIKKIKKIVKSKVSAFKEHAATFISGCLGTEKSDARRENLLCRSTGVSVDRHRDNVGLQILQNLPSLQEEVNPSMITRAQCSQISVPTLDGPIRQETPIQTCPTDQPIVLQSEKLEALSPEGVPKAIHEDKILDLSLSAILPETDTRRTRGRLSRPFDSCD